MQKTAPDTTSDCGFLTSYASRKGGLTESMRVLQIAEATAVTVLSINPGCHSEELPNTSAGRIA